ncbi:MAG: hypothetical protein QXY45_03940 [Candidatus Aenigmatarchaeota archaeon]
MKKKVFFVPIIFLFLIFGISDAIPRPTSTIPPSPKKVGLNLINFFLNLLSILGIPSQWLVMPQIIYLVFVPILSIWIIVYGFLMEIRIFKRVRWVNLPLSFLITFSTIPLGIFYLIVHTIFTIMSFWSVFIFALMFFVGTWFLYKKRSSEWGTAASVAAAYKSDIDSLKGELSQKRLELIEIRRKIAMTANADRRQSLEQREQNLKQEIQSLRERIEELVESYRS